MKIYRPANSANKNQVWGLGESLPGRKSLVILIHKSNETFWSILRVEYNEKRKHLVLINKYITIG